MLFPIWVLGRTPDLKFKGRTSVVGGYPNNGYLPTDITQICVGLCSVWAQG